jgi:hypothetical protein
MEAEVFRPTDSGTSLHPEKRAAAADVLAGELQRRIGAPLRTIIWERASLAASLAGLTVDVTKAEAALRKAAGRDGRS